MASVNDELLDLGVQSKVRALQVSKSVAEDVSGLLVDSEHDLSGLIVKRLAKIQDRGFDTGPATTSRLEALKQDIVTQTAQLDKAFGQLLHDAGTHVALTEGARTHLQLANAMPPMIDVVRAPAALLKSLVDTHPFQGRILSDWVADLSAARVTALERAITIGMVQGETTDQIAKRVFGTAALGWTDGALQPSRRWADTVARTSVNAFSAAARQATFQHNDDILKGWRFTATLDSRTTPQCQALDGKIFPLGQGPIPPLHPNCRSTVVPITKSWQELGIKANELPAGTRASMDGQVPADLTYGEWLAKQSAGFQDEVLGPTRGAMFRQGVPVEKFVDAQLQPLTIGQLKTLGVGPAAPAITVVAPVPAPALAAAKASYEKALGEFKALQAAAAQAEAATPPAAGLFNGVYVGKLQAIPGAEKTNVYYATVDGKQVFAKVVTDDAVAAREATVGDIAKVVGFDRTPKVAVGIGELPNGEMAQLSVQELVPGTALDQYHDAFEAMAILPEHMTREEMSRQMAFDALVGAGDRSRSNFILGLDGKIRAVDYEISLGMKHIPIGQSTIAKDGFLKVGADWGSLGKIYVTDADAVIDRAALESIWQHLPEALKAVDGTAVLTGDEKAAAAVGMKTRGKAIDALLNEYPGDIPLKAFIGAIDQSAVGVEPLVVPKAKVAAAIAKPAPAVVPALPTAQLEMDLTAAEQAVVATRGAVSQAGELRAADLVKIGEKPGGSVEGYLARNVGTGDEWLVKFPVGEDAARNEVLAGKLYQAAGIEVPELRLVRFADPAGGERVAVASKMIPGLRQDAAALKAGELHGIYDGFGVDAWLANWDAVGMGYDNMLVTGDRAIRIDLGGALRYRAQGGMKGALFGNHVTELDSMRAAMAPEAASVFGPMSEARIEEAVARVLRLQPDDIARLVKQYGPLDATQREGLLQTLLARRDDLAIRFPNLLIAGEPAAVPAAEAAVGGQISGAEFRTIEAARGNGLAVLRDGTAIEDHAVRLHQFTESNGSAWTGGILKVHGDTVDSLLATARGSVQASAAARSPLEQSFTAFKNDLATFTKDLGGMSGSWISSGGISNVQTTIASLRTQWDGVLQLAAAEDLDATVAGQMIKAYQPVIDKLLNAVTGMHTIKFTKPTSAAAFLKFELPAAPAPVAEVAVSAAEKVWIRQDPVWRATENVNGNARRLAGRPILLPGGPEMAADMYETSIDGVRVRYFASDKVFALKGRLEIEVPGNTQESAQKVLDTLEKLGVSTARPTTLDAEEMYLTKIAWHDRDYWDEAELAMKAPTQAERVAGLRKVVSDGMGVDDVTALPTYNPAGRHQAFDHGYILFEHPAPLPADVANLSLLHSTNDLAGSLDKVLNSGGQLAPTTDLLRRGIRLVGASPESDLKSGGANYVFTRLRKTGDALDDVGFVFDSSILRRLDTISYDGDNYGQVNDPLFLREFRRTMKQLVDAADHGSNETFFKEGLSLFDGLKHIATSSPKQRDDVLAVLHNHGLDIWPDGRRAADIVTVRSTFQY